MNDSVGTSKFWVVVVTALISFFAGSVIGPSIEKIIPEVLKPSLSITGLEAKKTEEGRVVEEDQITDFITFRGTVNNNNIMPGFIEDVKFFPITPAARMATFEVISIDRHRIWMFKNKTITMRISSTIPINDTTTYHHLEFTVHFFDNYKQQILDESIKFKVVMEDNTKKPYELYEALRAKKSNLRINCKREREIISRTIASAKNEADAFFNIAVMYEQCSLLPHDVVEAIDWYKIAETRGKKDAKEKVKELEGPFFSNLSIRKNILTVNYIINNKRELIETLYNITNRKEYKPKSVVEAHPETIILGKKYKPGKYKVISCINADNRVTEADYSNNCKEIDFTVQSGS